MLARVRSAASREFRLHPHYEPEPTDEAHCHIRSHMGGSQMGDNKKLPTTVKLAFRALLRKRARVVLSPAASP